MPLFETIPVDEKEVADIVKNNWAFDISKCLKSSQNHTFLASDSSKNYIIRVTPDPHSSRRKDIELEVKLLEYLHLHKLSVSRTIPTKNGEQFIVNSAVIIVAFEYAKG